MRRFPRYRCSLLIPEGWHCLELESVDGSGEVILPDPEQTATSFSLEGLDLGTAVTRGDLSPLKRGFLAGIRALPEAQIEQQEAEAVGRLITMEARHTFRDGEAIRKRWCRLLYQGTVQIRLLAQGESPAEFDHWEPMFFQMMRTFRFGDWWAEATGVEWVESPFADEEER